MEFELNDEIMFLYRIVDGGSDHSLGIQVARLAGMPQEVIERAREVLRNLEQNELTPGNFPKKAVSSHTNIALQTRQISLFEPMEHPIINEIRQTDIDHMSPFDALLKLKEWKDKM